jgi:hypothetical protein
MDVRTRLFNNDRVKCYKTVVFKIIFRLHVAYLTNKAIGDSAGHHGAPETGECIPHKHTVM